METTSENRVGVYSWHFMRWPDLDADFDANYASGWVTVPNSLFDPDKARGLYQEYIDELAYADEVGFDGVVLNEHHQNIYGLMPSPNLIAAALSQRTTRSKIVVLGNLIPLHFRPLRVAEEYAMLDCMTGGRVIAGLAPRAVQLLVQHAAGPRALLGGARSDRPGLDPAGAYHLRGQALLHALRQ